MSDPGFRILIQLLTEPDNQMPTSDSLTTVTVS